MQMQGDSVKISQKLPMDEQFFECFVQMFKKSNGGWKV